MKNRKLHYYAILVLCSNCNVHNHFNYHFRMYAQNNKPILNTKYARHHAGFLYNSVDWNTVLNINDTAYTVLSLGYYPTVTIYKPRERCTIHKSPRIHKSFIKDTLSINSINWPLIAIKLMMNEKIMDSFILRSIDYCKEVQHPFEDTMIKTCRIYYQLTSSIGSSVLIQTVRNSKGKVKSEIIK